MAKFVDPLDEEADAAEGALVNKHAGALAKNLRASAEDETDEVEVLEPEDDDEETETVPTRKEKRGARLSAREARAVAEAKAEAYKEALALSGRAAPAPGAPAPAPHLDTVRGIDARIRANYEAQEALHEEWTAKAGKSSAGEIKRMKDKAVDLDVEKTTLIADRRDALQAPQRQQQAEYEAQKARHPDVYGNERALQYARGEFNKRLAAGDTASQELADACMAEAREVVLGKRPPPDAGRRARASGMSSGVRAGAAGEQTKLSMPRGSALYKMAVAMYPNEEPAVACQKWANRNGKPYLAAAGQRR